MKLTIVNHEAFSKEVFVKMKEIRRISLIEEFADTLKEISTNANYILNEKAFDINVEYNKTTSQTITNEHKKGNIKVYKVDKDNKKVVLGNVEFQLYSGEFKKVVGTYYTDVNGDFETKNMRTGNYK